MPSTDGAARPDVSTGGTSVGSPAASAAAVDGDSRKLLRERDRSIELEHDRHIEGLFSRSVWLQSLAKAGYQATVVPFEESESAPEAIDVFVGRRRS